jgi:decaprenyl-phosphate phosphoribosyltransferase
MKKYLELARFDHYIKNLFIFPGWFFYILLSSQNSEFSKRSIFKEIVTIQAVLHLIFAFIGISLISSANYTINEWLDRNTDRYHPDKQGRRSVYGKLSPSVIAIQYCSFATVGGLLLLYINPEVFYLGLFLLIMGLMYNVKPIRTKDIAYLDVVSESVNNPIRLAVGWYSLGSSQVIPTSLLLSFMFAGIFLMSMKRYVEMQILGEEAHRYRKSFAKWTPENLLTFAFGSSILATLFVGIFLVRVNIEYILSTPLLVVLFCLYLNKSLHLEKVGYKPEKLFREKTLIALSLTFFLSLILLSFIDINLLDRIITGHP